MRKKSIFPYFGGKYFLLDDILRIVDHLIFDKKIKSVVDVFGGSAKLLTNIPNEINISRVYNDINEYLYNLFKVLQDKDLFKELERKINIGFKHERAFLEFKQQLFDNTENWSVPDVNIAYATLYILVLSFGSKLHKNAIFKREFKLRNGYKQLYKLVDVVKSLHLEKWAILNEPYEKVIQRANKPYVFLYLDPPYLRGGSNYQYGSWTIDNFKKLYNQLLDFEGYWLLNESSIDEISSIFGKPKFIKEYQNTFGKDHHTTRKEGFWTNFDIPDGVINNVL